MGSVLNHKEKNQPTPTERHAPETVLEEEAELGCDFDTFDRLNSWSPCCEFVCHTQANIRPTLLVNTISLSKMDACKHLLSKQHRYNQVAAVE